MKTALIVILALLVIIGGAYAYKNMDDAGYGDEAIACTMDAMICPDGSYVGRSGPNCEFAACPTGTSSATTTGISGTVTGGATTSIALPKTATITYTSSGFSPKTVILAKGGTVNFVNKSNDNLWVASDPHPNHSGYPGFDAKKSIMMNETWTFKFDQLGSWGYHNHIVSQLGGMVIVQ